MRAPAIPERIGWDRRTWAWLGLLLLAAAVYAGRHWSVYDGFVDAARDESIYLPAILKHARPGLFANDYFLSHFQLSTGVFLDLSSFFLKLAGGDYRAFLLTYSTALLFVFVSGVFVLARSLTGSPAAASLAGLLLMRPREAMGGVGFAVYVGNYQPRMFIDALTPWLFWLFLRNGAERTQLLIGGVLGLASLFYPVYPLQLAAVLFLMALFLGRRRGAVLLGLAFTAFFLPYNFHSMARAAAPFTAATRAIIDYRWQGQIYPDLPTMAGEFLRNFSLPLALAAAGLWAAPGLLRAGGRFRAFLWVVPAVLIVMAAGFLSYLVPAGLPVMPQRLGRLFHLLFLIAGASGAAALFSEPGRSAAKSVCAGLVLANLLFTSPLRLPGGRGEAARGPAPYDQADFLTVAAEVRRATPQDAVFLIPPKSLNNFMIYAERGIVTSYKTVPSVSDPEVLARWYADYRKVSDAYSSGDLGRLRAVAAEYGAGYILVLGASPATKEKPLFGAGEFRVFPAARRRGAKGAV
ncbi:MAG: hypothetical protein M0025_06620 [Elusimicrobia bacterium]|nr:hypothetical protein [Elusimicrobiota bacterium]